LKDISKLAVVLGLKLNLRDEEITIILNHSLWLVDLCTIRKMLYSDDMFITTFLIAFHEVQPILAKRIIPKYVAFACTCIYDEAFGFQFQNYLKAERKISCRGYLMF